MEANFRLLNRAIIGIAYNLHHNRDLRYFLDYEYKLLASNYLFYLCS